MPRVSVIMGIYNCEKTLDRAIQSIIGQTYTDWELILCDDASTDGTAAVARKYADQDSRIILLRNEENRKLAYSLNRCLECSRGEYIARMDADDVSLPERFEKQIAFLDGHPEYAVVACRAYVFDENGERGIRETEGEPDPKSIFTRIPYMHPTIMMRKTAYDKLGGYTVAKRTNKGQDADLWFRFTAAGFRGYVLGEPLYKYHESPGDLKRRTLKQAFYRCQTRIIGLRLNKAPWIYYLYAVKPILSALTPNFLLHRFRNSRLQK